jgi:hypothetical protein
VSTHIDPAVIFRLGFKLTEREKETIWICKKLGNESSFHPTFGREGQFDINIPSRVNADFLANPKKWLKEIINRENESDRVLGYGTWINKKTGKFTDLVFRVIKGCASRVYLFNPSFLKVNGVLASLGRERGEEEMETFRKKLLEARDFPGRYVVTSTPEGLPQVIKDPFWITYLSLGLGFTYPILEAITCRYKWDAWEFNTPAQTRILMAKIKERQIKGFFGPQRDMEE